MTLALTIIVSVLLFSLMVIMHEFGHFIFARIFGVKVDEFAVGMGPKLFGIKGKKTEYTLRLFPIGGFCSMVGEQEQSDAPDALCNKPVWQRLIIMAAGALMNIVFGIIITAVIVCSAKAIGGRTVAVFDENALSNGQGGLCEGDEILKIGRKNVYTTSDISFMIMHDGTEPVDITVKRNGEKLVLRDVRFGTESAEQLNIGVMDFRVYAVKKTFSTVLYNAFFESWSNVRMIWSSLFDIVTGRYGIKAVSGPIGVTGVIGDAVKEVPTLGLGPLLYLISFISMNLGVFNLLPLPALDGGHIIFLLIELIRGKKIKPEHENLVHFAGFALLILLMLVVTFNDIVKLIGG